MFDDIPIVPNLYEAPSNPQAKDCYYNITLDKYYIYDGTQWLEAQVEKEPTWDQQYTFELKYSMDDGANFTSATYNDFNSLCTALNSSPINNASNIIITTPKISATLTPRSNDTSLDGVALLKLKILAPGKKDIFELKYSKDGGTTFTTEEYYEFYALQNRMASSTMSGVTNIEVSMEEVDDPNIVQYVNEPSDIFVLQYSEDGGITFQTQRYTDYDSLIEDIHSSFLSQATDITIYMEKGSSQEGPIDDNNFIVGKIYPKIIFNQKLVENLVMNTNEVNNNIFDGVLTFYKEVPKTSKYRVSFKNPGDTEWTTYEFNDVNEAIEVINRWSENSIPTSAREVKFEEIE